MKANNVWSVWPLTFVSNQYSHDEAVDGDDTRHDNRDDRLHDEIGPHHTHGRNTHTTLGCAVGSTQCCTEREREREREREESGKGVS